MWWDLRWANLRIWGRTCQKNPSQFCRSGKRSMSNTWTGRKEISQRKLMNFDENGALRSKKRLVKVVLKMCKGLRLWSEKECKDFVHYLTHTQILEDLFSSSSHDTSYEWKFIFWAESLYSYAKRDSLLFFGLFINSWGITLFANSLDKCGRNLQSIVILNNDNSPLQKESFPLLPILCYCL